MTGVSGTMSLMSPVGAGPAYRDRTPLVTATLPDPLVAYQTATTRIAGIHREIAQTRRAELIVKTATYVASSERSASGREDEARYAAAHHTAELLDLFGERDALSAEIDFLKQYLHLYPIIEST